jgi:hypothetical protein
MAILLKNSERVNYFRCRSFYNLPLHSEMKRIADFQSYEIALIQKVVMYPFFSKRIAVSIRIVVNLVYRFPLQFDKGLYSSQFASVQECALRSVDEAAPGHAKSARSALPALDLPGMGRPEALSPQTFRQRAILKMKISSLAAASATNPTSARAAAFFRRIPLRAASPRRGCSDPQARCERAAAHAPLSSRPVRGF